MSSYGCVVLGLALAIVSINAVPLSQEYGTPFDIYGLPPGKEIHDEVRPVEVVPKIDIQFDTPLIAPIVQLSTVAPEILPVHRVPEKVPVVTIPVKSPKVIVAPPNSHVSLRDGKNQYSVGFQSPDGTEVKEQGRLISTDNGWEYVIAKTGSYKYVSPEGKDVAVEWIADEKGFRILSTTV